MASISVGAERGGGACSGTAGSRRFSIVLRSVGAERGGCGCAGTAGTRRFSIVSRLTNPTEGPVTAATTCSIGPSVGSLTAYTASSVGFTTLRSSAWLSHTLHLSTGSLMGFSGGTVAIVHMGLPPLLVAASSGDTRSWGVGRAFLKKTDVF